MKKMFLNGMAALALIGCQKSPSEKTSAQAGAPVTTTAQEEIKKAERYVAEDGKDVQVTRGFFQNHPYIRIRANGKDIQVINRQSQDTMRFEENGIVVTQYGDSLKIEQQNQVIKLRRGK